MIPVLPPVEVAFGAVEPLPPIFVADDDPDDLFFSVRLVKRTGTKHPVMTFGNAAGVMDHLTREWLETLPARPQLPPRLLFLDLKMDGLSGFAFLEWIAKHPELAAVHVVVLSGSDEPVDLERAKSLGAKRYLAKHPSVSTFARIIAHVYGESAVAADTLPRGYAVNEFFTESVPVRPRSRMAWSPVS